MTRRVGGSVMGDLFSPGDGDDGRDVRLGTHAGVLRGFALAWERALVRELDAVAARSPFRHMLTPGGFRMSVAMTNCGEWGWISDPTGYRYTTIDPQTGRPWAPMPGAFLELATQAAARLGFAGFVPDACLINRYEPGAKLSLHQDKDERDLNAPIVSVSLGLPAVLLFGGLRRAETPRRVLLAHGDVVVWGGPDRLRYHGVLPIKDGQHPRLGCIRVNLSFRKAAA